jgi:hypothetical protein
MKVRYNKIYISIKINKMLGGEAQQTFSARNWQRKRDGLPHLVFAIDFALGKGHCCDCWINWKLRRYHD